MLGVVYSITNVDLFPGFLCGTVRISGASLVVLLGASNAVVDIVLVVSAGVVSFVGLSAQSIWSIGTNLLVIVLASSVIESSPMWCSSGSHHRCTPIRVRRICPCYLLLR